MPLNVTGKKDDPRDILEVQMAGKILVQHEPQATSHVRCDAQKRFRSRVLVGRCYCEESGSENQAQAKRTCTPKVKMKSQRATPIKMMGARKSHNAVVPGQAPCRERQKTLDRRLLMHKCLLSSLPWTDMAFMLPYGPSFGSEGGYHGFFLAFVFLDPPSNPLNPFVWLPLFESFFQCFIDRILRE